MRTRIMMRRRWRRLTIENDHVSTDHGDIFLSCLDRPLARGHLVALKGHLLIVKSRTECSGSHLGTQQCILHVCTLCTYSWPALTFHFSNITGITLFKVRYFNHFAKEEREKWLDHECVCNIASILFTVVLHFRPSVVVSSNSSPSLQSRIDIIYTYMYNNI